MRLAVITIVSGRHLHLQRQEAALRRSTRPADVRVVVSMDDPDVAGLVPGADVVHVPRRGGHLPLAEARNAGVARARARGAELLVLLDVDCLPEEHLLARYAEVAATHDGLLCGPVGYLPPAPPAGHPPADLRDLAPAHPARPVPADDEVLPNPDPTLFWSLSFAATLHTWDRVGGFCTDYVGYGGEDTDVGQAAAAAGVPLWWVGGAWAFHQHHGDPLPGPPVQHLHDVVRNAGVFHDRWGWWPMRGWLDAFAERGLARQDPASGRWEVVAP